MSVIYESGASEEGPNFNPFIFDTSEFYEDSGDYAIAIEFTNDLGSDVTCLLYTSPSPRDGLLSRMPSSA